MSEKLPKFPKPFFWRRKGDFHYKYEDVTNWNKMMMAKLQKFIDEEDSNYVCRICHMDSVCKDDCIAIVRLREVSEALGK